MDAEIAGPSRPCCDLEFRDRTATIYSSSQLNPVRREGARYDGGLEAHKRSRPSPKRSVPVNSSIPAPRSLRPMPGNCKQSTWATASPPFAAALPFPTGKTPERGHTRYDGAGRLRQSRYFAQQRNPLDTDLLIDSFETGDISKRNRTQHGETSPLLDHVLHWTLHFCTITCTAPPLVSAKGRHATTHEGLP